MILKLLTLLLMCIFYTCYIIKMLQQRRNGIKTDQLGKDKQGTSLFIEVALKCTTYLIVVIQVIFILLANPNKSNIIGTIGVAITGLGVAIFVISVLQMRDNWRAGVSKNEETELVTTGIYSISRNPAFVGFDLMYIGILFTFFHWLLCLVTLWAIALFHFQIVEVEEKFLEEKFGKDYLEYKSKVGRYLGRR